MCSFFRCCIQWILWCLNGRKDSQPGRAPWTRSERCRISWSGCRTSNFNIQMVFFICWTVLNINYFLGLICNCPRALLWVTIVFCLFQIPVVQPHPSPNMRQWTPESSIMSPKYRPKSAHLAKLEPLRRSVCPNHWYRSTL